MAFHESLQRFGLQIDFRLHLDGIDLFPDLQCKINLDGGIVNTVIINGDVDSSQLRVGKQCRKRPFVLLENVVANQY